MIQVIARTSDRRHKSLPLPLSQEDDAWCRPRFSAVISLCQAGGKGSYLVPHNWYPCRSTLLGRSGRRGRIERPELCALTDVPER
jgi:hypothetical protein